MSIRHLERLIKRKGKVYTKEEVDAFYASNTWKRCRKTILEKYDYLCQKCLEDNIPIPANTVHHIIPLRDDPTLALEESNLISLCRECHEKEHDRIGVRGDTNKELPKGIKVISVKGNPNKVW